MTTFPLNAAAPPPVARRRSNVRRTNKRSGGYKAARAGSRYESWLLNLLCDALGLDADTMLFESSWGGAAQHGIYPNRVLQQQTLPYQIEYGHRQVESLSRVDVVAEVMMQSGISVRFPMSLRWQKSSGSIDQKLPNEVEHLAALSLALNTLGFLVIGPEYDHEKIGCGVSAAVLRGLFAQARNGGRSGPLPSVVPPIAILSTSDVARWASRMKKAGTPLFPDSVIVASPSFLKTTGAIERAPEDELGISAFIQRMRGV